ncbi:MAG: phosphatidylinositol-specific phospholipase C domain-containing protein [Oscillospiraceae bacterium]|nr:phosphatidylinositol-specific phospholipase C domain-containing protein [Oscillospiraceae bacterium]
MSEKKTGNKKNRPLRVLGRILAWILAALLLFLLIMYIIPLTETGDKTAIEGSADWMKELPDETPLNALALPGTHDSATQYVQLGFFSKCQSKSIGEQLEAGYRYLDVRLAVSGDGMELMHGFTKCRSGPMPWNSTLTLDAVLEDCYAFLSAHPTETVVFAVKQEHGGESVKEFQTILNRYVQEKPEFWLQSDTIPALGEARGKLVLLRRYEDEAGLGAAAGIPLLWANQNGHEDTNRNTVSEPNGSYTLWVQDRFEYDTEDKWNAFLGGLDAAGSGEEDLAIHFLSTKGTAPYGHPYTFAKALNPRLMELEELKGWVIVDFGSASMAQWIYQNNFR